MKSRALPSMITVIALAALSMGPTTVAAEDSTQVRVIVELAAAPALAEVPSTLAMAEASQRSEALQRDQQEVVARAGVDIEVIHHLTAAYNGLVVELSSADVGTLEELPGVRAVHADTSYATTLDDSVPLVGAPQVWERTDPAGQSATGAGMVVAVVDTGIDYLHPDLGGGFGAEHKVVAGYDVVNDDADPMDDNGHGTHVAGIVAADGAVRGVAPDATLTAYKVLDSSGNGVLSDILAGLDAAVDPANPHRADVVNMSFSGPGDGADPLGVAASQAAEAGIVMVGAAGNAGPGAQTVRSPAAADGVLAVGASASNVWVPRARLVDPTEQDLRAVRYEFSADPPASPIVADAVDVGEGQPGSYDDVDVAGKAVLIHHTTANAVEKALHAEERGAVAVFFYFEDFWGFVPQATSPAQPASAPPGTDMFAPGVDDGRLERIMVMHIPGASAAAVQTHLADGAARVEISGADATDQLASFSSRGPSGLFTAKPDLVAPGVEVLSTLPDASHGRASGTSMAAPHVAGVAALLRQLHPDWTARQVSGALAGSAHRVDDSGPLDQGAGRLDAPAAADANVVAATTSLSFGLADLGGDELDRTVTLPLSNLGDVPATASLTVEPDQTPGASVTVSPAAVQLAAGADAEVQVRVTLPTPPADGDVSGWVNVDVGGDGTTDVSVPYLLAVRHLTLHITPDPVPAQAQTTIFVRSPAELVSPPQLEVSCPGRQPQQPVVEPFGTRLWRATVAVGDAGLCEANVTGIADKRYGTATLTGTNAFEVAAAPRDDRGTSHWQPIGPNSAAGFLAFGASRTRMAVVPVDAGSIFVTEDRMRTWREVRTMPIAGGQAVDVAVDPADDDIMYVAVNGRSGGDPTYQGRVLRTDDGGRSWEILPVPDVAVDQIALTESGEVLAVADASAVRLSSDRGATWTELPSSWSGLQDLHWIGPDLYLATFSGLLVIRDAAGPNPSAPEVLFRPGSLGWAGRVTGDAETIIVSRYPFPELYASHDGGATFELIFGTTGISYQDLELVGDDIYALTPANLWIGSDRGQTWESWGDPQGNAVEFDIGQWPGAPGDVFVASHGAGLYTADEPGIYDRVGIPGAHVYDLAVGSANGDETLVAGTIRDSFQAVLPNRESIRPGDLEWRSSGGEGISRGADAQFLATSPADPSVVYKVRAGAFLTFSILRSDDGGTTWEHKSSPSEFATALLVHPADPDRIYVGYTSVVGAGLVVSEDGGETWRKVDQGRVFTALAGDPTDPDRIWAGDFAGLYVSEDGGLSFRQVADVAVSAIAVDPADPDRLVVGGRGMFTSDDGGETLRPAHHVDLDMWVSDIVFAADSSQVFAGTTAFYDELGVLRGGRGVLASVDGGATWESFAGGLANPNVTSLAFSADGRHLFAGTFGGSVHRMGLPGRQ